MGRSRLEGNTGDSSGSESSRSRSRLNQSIAKPSHPESFVTGLPLPSLKVLLRGRQNREVGVQGPELVLPNLERALLNLEQVPPQSLVLDLQGPGLPVLPGLCLVNHAANLQKLHPLGLLLF